MSWREVKKKRDDKQFKEARELALKLLAADPGDFMIRSQLEWVTFGEIKLTVSRIESALKASERPRTEDLKFIWTRWEEYRQSEPRVPEMACSMIVGQVTKVGYLLPRYADIVHWLRSDGLRDEDWLPNEYQGKTYPSLGAKIALALCKWIKSNPELSTDGDLDMALEWIDRSRERSTGDYQLWLNWNAAILFRQRGEMQRATELLTGVIKAKRNEFWVWAEAGRLYRSEEPELALSCFCRALECPAEPKFLVRTHRELAELLAEQGEFAQASREIAITVDIRQAEGWPVGREMEALMARPWYDPSSEGAENPKEFYSQHAPAALELCFDVVEASSANYLGLLMPHTPKEPRPGWKPRPFPRFAIKDAQGKAWTVVGPGMKKLKFDLGAPLTVIIGRQEGADKQTIVHVSTRTQGKHWDCLETGLGVVVREASDEKPIKVFVASTGDEASMAGPADDLLRIGDGVRFGLVRNPRNGRIETFNVDRGDIPRENVRTIQGQLRRNPKGFAFVDDAFVAPPLVDSLGATVDDVIALAIYGKHPKEDKRTWRVISLTPAT